MSRPKNSLKITTDDVSGSTYGTEKVTQLMGKLTREAKSSGSEVCIVMVAKPDGTLDFAKGTKEVVRKIVEPTDKEKRETEEDKKDRSAKRNSDSISKIFERIIGAIKKPPYN